MGDIYFKNSIISFILIISTVLTPVAFIPKKAEAQTMSAYISGIGPAANQLPLCKGKLSSGIKNLFTGDFQQEDLLTLGEKMGSGLVSTVEDVVIGQESIPVLIDPTTRKSISDTKFAAEETQKSVSLLEANDTCLKSIGRMMIKMLLQKMTLSTVEWINSGYDGSPMFLEDPKKFFGDIAKNEILQFGAEISNPELFPFGKAFMQNQAIAFQNKFADNARYSLNELIKKTTPEYSAETFRLDFTQGGWNAWEALTQIPANNPIGFNLMASNELGKRLEGTTQSTANTIRAGLQESGGYLGSERCVEPSGVTREEHEEALRINSTLTNARMCTAWNSPDENGKITCKTPEGLSLEEHQRALSEKNETSKARICNRWEYVTPGKMVADAATKIVNYPDNNLLKAEDLNDAVAAILDAVLNNFATDLMSDSGFAGLGDSVEMMQGADGTFVSNSNLYGDDGRAWTEADFPGSLIAGSSFLQENRNFNIRTDLNQALIDEQRIFIDKLREQNKEILSTEKAEPQKLGYTGNYGLIPVINQLDYCIPGPHPGWEIDSRDSLNAALSVVVPETETSITKDGIKFLVDGARTATTLGAAVAGAAIGSAIPVVGTIIGAVIGVGVSAIINYFETTDTSKRIENYYASYIASFTGLKVSIGEPTPHDDVMGNLHSKQKMSIVLNEILNRYKDIIKDVYPLSKLPSVATEAAQKFNLGKGYAKMFSNNEERMVSMASLIVRLEEIKKEIDKLNKELEDGTIKDRDGNIVPNNINKLSQQEQYEENLQPWINSFGRLSSEMVNGDDIAAVDNLKKEIVDERDYIYKNLLKGPNGCEKDLELERGRDGKGLHMRTYQTKRPNYPGPILYDYNDWTTADKEIPFPDPFDSGYTENKMVRSDYLNGTLGTAKFNESGPSFLNFIWMGADGVCDKAAVRDVPIGMYLGCIKLDDLLPIDDGEEYVPMGYVTPKWDVGDIAQNNETRNGLFEIMIAIY